MDQTITKSVGRFELSRLLTHEGRVPVYLAVDPTLNRNVAIKLVDLADLDPGARKEFDRRVHLMEGLRHTNLCPVLEVGQIGDLNYLAMAFIKGHSLQEFAERKSVLQPKQVALLVGKLALAVNHMHRAGLLHGYLSPDSVVIDPSGEPVIVDLGLAQSLPANNELDASAPYQGFLAPEVEISGGADSQIASDIYSIGAIGFRMLTGRIPGSEDEVASALLPSGLSEPLAARFKQAFCLAMAFEPSKRFKTALELATVMDELFRDTPLSTAESKASPVSKQDSISQPDATGESSPNGYTQFDLLRIGDSHIVHLHDASVLSGEAIAQSKTELFQLVDSDAPHRLIINFASVQFCSSATVGILIQLEHELKPKGTQLYLCGMRESIREVFRVLNLDGSVFEIRETVANALKSAE